MALPQVIRCCRFHDGDSGSVSQAPGGEPKSQFVEAWIAETDAPANQSLVLAYFLSAPDTPRPGSVHAPEPGLPGVAVVTQITARRQPSAAEHWLIEVTYTPIEPGDGAGGGGGKTPPKEKPGDDGKLTSDPLRWATEIAESFYAISEAVTLGKYLGGMRGHADGLRGRGTWGGIVNSAGVPFDPPPEEETYIRVLRFATNVAQMFNFSGVIGAVNKDRLNVQKNRPWKFSLKAGVRAARIAGIEHASQFENGVFFFRRTVEIQIHPRDWDLWILDRGTSARAIEGDPDGRGGVVDYTLVPFREGVPEQRRLVDADDVPITEPILLDGDGQPLRAGREGVYLRYQTKEETAFGILNWIHGG